MDEWTVEWTRWNQQKRFLRKPLTMDYTSSVPDNVPLLPDQLAKLLIKHNSIRSAGTSNRSPYVSPALFTYGELTEFANCLLSGFLDDEKYAFSDLVNDLTDDDLDRFQRFVGWAERSHSDWAENYYVLIPVDEVSKDEVGG